MPTTYHVYLNGGPCNGTTRTLTRRQFAAGSLTCKGTTYIYNPDQVIAGHRYIFDAVPTQTGGGGGGGTRATGPQAYTGWEALRRSLNRELPAAVRAISRNQAAALRELGHRHRVRG